VRRFCLDCSKKKGVLVERTCPALDKRRAAKATQQAAKRKKTAERAKLKVADRWTFGGVDLRDELKRLVRLKCWKWYFKRYQKRGWRVPYTTLRISKTKAYTSGRAWPGGRMVMTIPADAGAGSACAILLHELTHVALPARTHHSKEFTLRLYEAAYEAYGVDLNPSAYSTKWAVQNALRRALIEKFVSRAENVASS
jgi:hypothetical protein